MRTSASQPRMGAKSKPVTLGTGVKPVQVAKASTKRRTLGGVVRALTSHASVSDMTRTAVKAAEQRAKVEGRAAGLTPEALLSRVKRARAEAIKRSAAAAGVSSTTARRWAAGTQKASRRANDEGKRAVQRSLGGARGLQAATLAATTKVSLGEVDVIGYDGKDEKRTLNGISVDPAVMASIAQKWRDGDEAEAMDDLGAHIMDQYGRAGAGLGSKITLKYAPNPSIWE